MMNIQTDVVLIMVYTYVTVTSGKITFALNKAIGDLFNS